MWPNPWLIKYKLKRTMSYVRLLNLVAVDCRTCVEDSSDRFRMLFVHISWTIQRIYEYMNLFHRNLYYAPFKEYRLMSYKCALLSKNGFCPTLWRVCLLLCDIYFQNKYYVQTPTTVKALYVNLNGAFSNLCINV